MASKYIRNITKIFKATSGVLFGRKTAGTGRGEELTPSDVRTLLSVSTTSETATLLAAKADLVGGFIPTAQIPAVAITEYLGSVASQVAMLALVGDRGDWCLRSDLGTTWVLSDDDSTFLASWTQLLYPTAPVTSVSGRTGAVTLSNTDISGLGTLSTQNGTFSGTHSGASSNTNTGDQTTIVGNAGSATVLQTARNINGVAFDGSASVTITAAGSTLSDTVTIAKGGTGLIALGTALQVLRVNAGATALEYATAGGSGDVVGPASATDNAIARFDTTTGKLIQNSTVFIGDTGAFTQVLSITGSTTVSTALAIASGQPSQITTAQAGNNITLAASAAQAGSTSVTAAAGGSVTISAGAAATNGSGSPFPAAVGGSVTIFAGAGASSGSASSNGGSVAIYSGSPGSGATHGSVTITAGPSASAALAYNQGTVTIGTVNNSGGAGGWGTGSVVIQTGTACTTAGATGTAAGPISVTTGIGGISSATGGTGGVGGALSLTANTGGAATGTSGTLTGGTGGSAALSAGTGGAATSASGTRNGGTGGAVTVSAGTGGAGTTANGNGGDVLIRSGAAGAGAGSAGVAGSVKLQPAGTTQFEAKTDCLVASKPVIFPSYTVAGLPAAASYPYARAFATDANATTFMSTVAGGGVNKVPVFSDGTNWLIG